MSTTLSEIIARLERETDLDRVVPVGFAEPHSYRGYYSDLAFTPARGVTVRSMLYSARSALSATFEGWKGGDYTMHEYTDVYYAADGRTGDTLGLLLLEYMLGGDPLTAMPPDTY